ncbi:MAG: 4-(cytidine 5'-diphospho)-2-C-methyl-D-erythritol kinase, partial [Acidobacteriota bacterium]|nr:4-(cytidine 5'-diphospho)-2-C-methyl-D-erythritol kinase [Acidobacteriota bacterium]
ATPAVFREADRLGPQRSAADLDRLYDELVEALAGAARLPRRLLVNDLQAAAVSLCPWCAEALAAVRAAGADDALVSGSGPTVVGVWWGSGSAARAAAAVAALRSEHPRALVAEPVAVEYAAPSLT